MNHKDTASWGQKKVRPYKRDLVPCPGYCEESRAHSDPRHRVILSVTRLKHICHYGVIRRKERDQVSYFLASTVSKYSREASQHKGRQALLRQVKHVHVHVHVHGGFLAPCRTTFNAPASDPVALVKRNYQDFWCFARLACFADVRLDGSGNCLDTGAGKGRGEKAGVVGWRCLMFTCNIAACYRCPSRHWTAEDHLFPSGPSGRSIIQPDWTKSSI